MQTQEIEKLTLELGDIIKIVSSSNTDLNDNIFYITYIDSNKCKILNIQTKNEIILNITDSEFDDKSIEPLVGFVTIEYVKSSLSGSEPCKTILIGEPSLVTVKL